VKILALLLPLLIAGCTTQQAVQAAANLAANQGSPPIVRTTNNGTGYLTVIACPMTQAGADTLSEYLQTLSNQSPIVTATTGGNSRLTINLCPHYYDAATIRAARGR
jgi:type IV pilus biogenesis protein CpaD/CtpE